jgi:hypothetical protein
VWQALHRELEQKAFMPIAVALDASANAAEFGGSPDEDTTTLLEP